MSEKEIRKLLQRACAELDRYARLAKKAMLPGAVGAGLAITGCASTPKPEAAPGPGPTDSVQAVADAGVVEAPLPDQTADAGAAVVEEAPPVQVADAAPQPVKRERPPDYDIPKPYMAPDAEPLYTSIDDERVA